MLSENQIKSLLDDLRNNRLKKEKITEEMIQTECDRIIAQRPSVQKPTKDFLKIYKVHEPTPNICKDT